MTRLRSQPILDYVPGPFPDYVLDRFSHYVSDRPVPDRFHDPIPPRSAKKSWISVPARQRFFFPRYPVPFPSRGKKTGTFPCTVVRSDLCRPTFHHQWVIFTYTDAKWMHGDQTNVLGRFIFHISPLNPPYLCITYHSSTALEKGGNEERDRCLQKVNFLTALSYGVRSLLL